MQIRAASSPWYSGVDFLLRELRKDGKEYIVTEMTYQHLEDGLHQEPTFRLSMKDAQVLMDDLWASGLRPAEGSGSAGSLLATEKHLQDMRKIVAKQLDVPL